MYKISKFSMQIYSTLYSLWQIATSLHFYRTLHSLQFYSTLHSLQQIVATYKSLTNQ